MKSKKKHDSKDSLDNDAVETDNDVNKVNKVNKVNGVNEVTDTQITTSALIDAVVESYEETGSFKKTAAALKISTAKVRKALLTAGVWTNETAESIAKAREARPDWSDQQIADELHISLNAVQMYTPYKLGPYAGDGASAERNARYREKNRAAADNVDMSRKELAGIMEQMAEKEESEYAITTHPYPVSTQPNVSEQEQDVAADIDIVDPFDLPLEAFAQVDSNAPGRNEKLGRPWEPGYFEKLAAKEKAAGLPFSRYRHCDDPDAKPYVDDQFYLDYRLVEHANYRGRNLHQPDAFRLRLEVDTEGMSAEELNKLHREYGVRTGWTRDLIVPSGMPLHYLHYVIQRAFGFENKADHLFQLPQEMFETIIEGEGGGALHNYARLCGAMFRFPFENDAEIYWDDDYDGKKSIRTWLKDKYTGAWNTHAGIGYRYIDNQYRIWKWLGDRVIDFHKLDPALDTYSSEEQYTKLEELGAPEEYSLGEMDDAGIEAIEGGQFPVNNVVESLKLCDFLTTETINVTAWDFVDDLERSESELLDGLLMYEKAQQAMREADEIYKILQSQMKAGNRYDNTLLVRRWTECAERAANLYMLSNIDAFIPYPFTNELIYVYDFGAKKGTTTSFSGTGCGNEAPKWKIRVKVEDAFHDYSEYYSRNYTPRDANGVDFEKDPEHEAEMADRLLDMCHWKEKLEILDDAEREVRPSNEADMMLPLRPEQELLPEEREEIEQYKAQQEETQRLWEEEFGKVTKEPTMVVDDKLYAALKTVMTEWVPVCIGKEGADPGEGYPDVKIRNSSIEKQV